MDEDNSIGVDFKINPDAPMAGELHSLSLALAHLYRDAAEKWPGRQLWVDRRTEGGIFTFQLSPAPADLRALIEAIAAKAA